MLNIVLIEYLARILCDLSFLTLQMVDIREEFEKLLVIFCYKMFQSSQSKMDKNHIFCDFL